MATCPGPLGCDSNQPTIDAGTNCLSECSPPVIAGSEFRAVEVSELERYWNRGKDWASELGEAVRLGGWWLIGSPSLGFPNGDWVFGPEDSETEHIRSTAAYLEAVEIYQDWLNNGQPLGKFMSDRGTRSEFVPSKGYFFVLGRTGKGAHGEWNTEPLEHPLWGFTGNFSIRFFDWGYPSEGYVKVEIENYTSLPSFFHGIAEHSILDEAYTKESGIPILSRSRQVYRFITYIPRNPPAVARDPGNTEASHRVVAGDSLSAIAKQYYGDPELWPIIFEANRTTIGRDPNSIKIGQILRIPPQPTPEQVKQSRQKARASPDQGVITVEPPR